MKSAKSCSSHDPPPPHLTVRSMELSLKFRMHAPRVWFVASCLVVLASGSVRAQGEREETPRAESAAITSVSADHPQRARESLQLFQNHVRSLLSTHCLRCHGGDGVKGDFDLSSPEALRASGHLGESAATSPLMAILRHEAEPVMPLDGQRLDDEALEHIAAWIDSGAIYDRPLVERPREGGAQDRPPMRITDEDRAFWSLKRLPDAEAILPSKATLRNPQWCLNAIDLFILADLERAGLTPSPPASPSTLVRRASLDLLGMPPGLDAVKEFEADLGSDAFERWVDRLLQSPQYGERWARHWMDVARFAESSGFEHDYDRPGAWHYRDYLIDAFNRDQPWDEMVRWQIAGDQIAPDNPWALRATGFLAAGVFPTQLTEAEFESARYDELDDMVGTLGVAFLGLSTGCARCHDHKFDPLPTADYYRLVAHFSRTIRAPKQVQTNDAEYRTAITKWDEERKRLEELRKQYDQQVVEPAFTAWLEKPEGLAAIAEGAWSLVVPQQIHSREGVQIVAQGDGSWLATGPAPESDEYTVVASFPAGTAALRIEALTDPSLPQQGPGRASNGNFALGNLTLTARSPLDASDASPQAPLEPLKIVRGRATHQQDAGGLSVASSFDSDPERTGWAVDFGGIGKAQAAVFVLDTPLAEDSLVTITMRFHVNGQHSLGRFRLAHSPDPEADFQLLAVTSADLTSAAAKMRSAIQQGRPTQEAAAELRAGERAELQNWFASRDPQWIAHREAQQRHATEVPRPRQETILVASEGLPPLPHHADDRGYPHFYPQVHQLHRGDVKDKEGIAEPGFLQVLTDPHAPSERWGLSTAELPDRVRLALWITDHEHGAGHLLARVIVNRLWHHHFGRGLVATPNDFGIQGDRPSHPQLLDYLAAELIASGWRLKPIHRLIMTSATYQQSALLSHTPQSDKSETAAAMDADPENRLLHHYRSRRLEGEAIRDSMLAVSGLLDPTPFGPGSIDPAMLRRSVYFTIKRSQPIPMMQVFDWPEHLVSIGQRSATTIAPQALALLNGPDVRRYASALAQRLLSGEQKDDLQAIVSAGYQLCFSRAPSAAEQQQAVAFLAHQEALHASQGNPALEALTDLCHALLNANEFLYIP